MLVSQCNLACTYQRLGRLEEALRIERDVYFGNVKLNGDLHYNTLVAISNYASSLICLKRFEEAKSLLPKAVPMARRVLGEGHLLTLKMRRMYAKTLYKDPDATLNDLREVVATLEDAERVARRLLGSAHPLIVNFERSLRESRAALSARDTPPP